MAKPSITKRSVKGAALTYNELDQNFQNLADATVSLTAGSGGTAITADLNGNITLVAGTNVTITGDNTAKTITINSTAAGSGTVNSGLSGALAYYPSAGTTVDDAPLTVTGTGTVTLAANGSTGALTIQSKTGTTFITLSDTNSVDINTTGSGSGDLRIYAWDGVQLSVSSGGEALIYTPISGSDFSNSIGFGSTAVRFPSRTTAQRDALTAVNGMVLYNTSTNKLQVRANGSWVDLH